MYACIYIYYTDKIYFWLDKYYMYVKVCEFIPNAWSAASASLMVSGLREGVGMPWARAVNSSSWILILICLLVSSSCLCLASWMRSFCRSLCSLRMYSTLALRMVPLFCLASLCVCVCIGEGNNEEMEGGKEEIKIREGRERERDTNTERWGRPLLMYRILIYTIMIVYALDLCTLYVRLRFIWRQ